jgi:hypothetical protein
MQAADCARLIVFPSQPSTTRIEITEARRKPGQEQEEKRFLINKHSTLIATFKLESHTHLVVVVVRRYERGPDR